MQTIPEHLHDDYKAQLLYAITEQIKNDAVLNPYSKQVHFFDDSRFYLSLVPIGKRTLDIRGSYGHFQVKTNLGYVVDVIRFLHNRYSR